MENEPGNNKTAKKLPDHILLIVGLLLLAVPLGFVLVAPGLFDVAQFYLKLAAALGGGLIGAFIPGALHVEFPGVRTGGALAIFYLVFSADPTSVVHGLIEPHKGQSVNFNACQDHQILHPSGHWQGVSSWSVNDGTLGARSDKGGLVQLLKVCEQEFEEPASEFDVNMGRVTVTYATDDVMGAQGDGLRVLFFCGHINTEHPTWGSWTNEKVVAEQHFSPSPRASSTINVPRTTFLVQCPKPTKQLTTLIVLSDPWKDTEMTARLDAITIAPR